MIPWMLGLLPGCIGQSQPPAPSDADMQQELIRVACAALPDRDAAWYDPLRPPGLAPGFEPRRHDWKRLAEALAAGTQVPCEGSVLAEQLSHLRSSPNGPEACPDGSRPLKSATGCGVSERIPGDGRFQTFDGVTGETLYAHGLVVTSEGGRTVETRYDRGRALEAWIWHRGTLTGHQTFVEGIESVELFWDAGGRRVRRVDYAGPFDEDEVVEWFDDGTVWVTRALPHDYLEAVAWVDGSRVGEPEHWRRCTYGLARSPDARPGDNPYCTIP